MSDATLRQLEREYASDPSDKILLERLQDERVRQGLGWHGERMPPGLAVSAWRGVYLWTATGAPEIPVGAPRRGGPTMKPPEALIQFVYVPGGEIACDRCGGQGFHSGPFGNTCGACGGVGARTIAPHYIGRFPLTLGQWRTFMRTGYGAGRQTAWMLSVDMSHAEHCPVVNVSLEDAKVFCGWAGLRLPSEAEWRWAALGGREHWALYEGAACAICKAPLERVGPETGARNGAYVVARCPKHGESESVHLVEPRRYPWGNDPLSPERCVWAGHLKFGPARSWGGSLRAPDFQGSTAPVIDCAACVDGTFYSPIHHNGICRDGSPGLSKDPLVPARPIGASWCGAHDMYGNVWEWLDSNYAAGGSFRSQPEALGTIASAHWFFGAPSGPAASDELGFRVALSAHEGASS